MDRVAETGVREEDAAGLSYCSRLQEAEALVQAAVLEGLAVSAEDPAVAVAPAGDSNNTK